MPFHDLPSSIKLMKASSNPDGICCHWYGSWRKGAMACSSSDALLLLTCSEFPKATACCTPRVSRSWSASCDKSGPRTDHVVRLWGLQLLKLQYRMERTGSPHRELTPAGADLEQPAARADAGRVEQPVDLAPLRLGESVRRTGRRSTNRGCSRWRTPARTPTAPSSS